MAFANSKNVPVLEFGVAAELEGKAAPKREELATQ